MSTISITDSLHAIIDGKDWGFVLDTALNNPKLGPYLQRALSSWKEQNDKDTVATIASASQDSVAARLEAEGAKAKLQSVLSAFSKVKDDHEAMKAALDTEMKPEVDAKRDALDKQIAELQAQKAALSA